jgi:hypothetical protein
MSMDDVECVNVDGSMSIASFWELIFTNEDVTGDGFCKEAFRFMGKSEMKIYSDLPGGKSRESQSHMSHATTSLW